MREASRRCGAHGGLNATPVGSSPTVISATCSVPISVLKTLTVPPEPHVGSDPHEFATNIDVPSGLVAVPSTTPASALSIDGSKSAVIDAASKVVTLAGSTPSTSPQSGPGSGFGAGVIPGPHSLTTYSVDALGVMDTPTGS